MRITNRLERARKGERVVEEGGGASRSTDPAAGTSAATDVSLREYVMSRIHALEQITDQRLDAISAQVQTAFESSQRAIDKADAATEKRFEGVNEFRAALSDQAKLFVTKEQLDAVSARLEAGYMRNREDIDALNDRMNLREGEVSGSRLTYGTMAGLLAAFATIIGLLVIGANYLSSH